MTAPKEGFARVRRTSYFERVNGDIDDIIDRAIKAAESTFYGGEAVPSFLTSFGPDEVAAFAGAELAWSAASSNTNWSKAFVDDWEDALPLRIRDDNPLWQRMLELYRRAAARMAGKMLLQPLDLHTNMDLLLAVRGGQRLCADLVDRPEMIDRAMADTMDIFRKVWDETRFAARMDEFGYCQLFYSMEGAATLQCDFSCMVSPEMFRRWILPALEEEASIVKHAMYHWDGPGALSHTADLIASPGLHTLAFVPGEGHGSHIDHLDLLKRVQEGGKAVFAWGTPEELKAMHRELRPEKVLYGTEAVSQAEAEALLDWFVRNT